MDNTHEDKLNKLLMCDAVQKKINEIGMKKFSKNLKLFKNKYSTIDDKCTEEEKLCSFLRKNTEFVEILMTPKSFIEKMIHNTNIPYPLKSNNIKLQKSDIHGFGIFAIEDIKKGSVITYYPSHAITDNIIKKNGHKKYMFNDEPFKINCDYKQKINNYSIFGNPDKVENALLLGHMINDSSCVCIDSDNISDVEIKNSVCRYILESNNNCMIKLDEYIGIAYIITTKNIKKNEEIHVSYFPEYWLDKHNNVLNIYKKIIEEDEKFKLFILNNIHKFIC
jgi:hypothetical protein